MEQEEIIDLIEDENSPSRYSITSYGADYDVEGIVAKIEKGKIFIPPFQRKYVWSIQRASRLIESLILGLPVPGIFLSTEKSTNKLLIVDGQQRIQTLHKYYHGEFDEGKPFRLKGVTAELEGKAYNDLSDFDRTRLDESILHATIIKQDEPDDGDSSVYMIFERLNTGGVPLRPQEVRACVYYGLFNELLISLTDNIHWRSLFSSKNTRMKEEELILRFFAFFFNWQDYKGNYKYFLNEFMDLNRNLIIHSKEELVELFNTTIAFIVQSLGTSAFKTGTQINAAIFDAVMIGVAERLKIELNPNTETFKAQYSALLSDGDFKSYVSSTTADSASVKGRIQKSISQFSNI